MSSGLLADARRLVQSGISVIPIKTDGTKAPAVSTWSPYRERMPTDEELTQWFAGGTAGIAAVCGPISGGLEVMDFDIPGKGTPEQKTDFAPAWEPYVALLIEHGYEDLLNRLVLCSTPSGGRHLAYRYASLKDGNQVLARTEGGKVLIETRGCGGYFLIHPTPKYVELRRHIHQVQTITEEERETLHSIARMLNEKVERAQVASHESHARGSSGAGLRPGDAYNDDGSESLEELLIAHGWTPLPRRHGKWLNFTRPGKSEGISGGISEETGLFHVFTTSTPFDAGKGYSKFTVYAVLEHGGDWKAAAGALRGKGYGEKGDRVRATTGMPSPGGDEAIAGREFITCLADIAAVPVDWLWYPYLPKGEPVLLAGDGGVGKTFVAMAIVACITTGKPLPWGKNPPVGNVLFVTAEDDLGKAIRPRADKAGVDLNRVFALELNEIVREDGGWYAIVLAEALKRNVVLIVIDPLQAFVAPGADLNKLGTARAEMRGFQSLARETGACVLLITHFNKNTGGKAQYRVNGSADIVNASRSSLMAGKVEDDGDELFVVAHAKSNYAAPGPTLRYEVIDDGADESGMPTSRFRWLGTVAVTAEDISTGQGASSKVNDASKFLTEVLEKGPVREAEMQARAEAAKISMRTLKRAKRLLGVTSARQGTGWVWSLPRGQDFQGCQDSPYGTLGTLEGSQVQNGELNIGALDNLGPLESPAASSTGGIVEGVIVAGVEE